MDSPYVSSYGSSLLQNSGSEEDLQALMDQKKRKRMISNRESARRSRMRKQKHLDGLTEQVNQLRKENGQSLAYLTLTTEQYFVMEAENSVLRTQMMELSNRLQYLNEILHCLNESSGLRHDGPWMNDSITNPWNLCMNHPITASADMLYY
ncbi:bZIP transcription factor 44-like [Zingiber officinale]|nr:bZIP transcription factor 44-like [Zingiber officinale]